MSDTQAGESYGEYMERKDQHEYDLLSRDYRKLGQENAELRKIETNILKAMKERDAIKETLKDAIEVIAMVEDHRKMPHQHKDAQTKLYCLTERAREFLEKHKETL